MGLGNRFLWTIGMAQLLNLNIHKLVLPPTGAALVEGISTPLQKKRMARFMGPGIIVGNWRWYNN
jgi:hypothetical protein